MGFWIEEICENFSLDLLIIREVIVPKAREFNIFGRNPINRMIESREFQLY